MSTMDSGFACSRYNIYGQMVYWVVTLDNITGVWMFTTWRWSYILRQVDDISGRYYNDVAIHQWNFYLLHTSHVDYTVSSSDVAIIDVCIYFAPRFAPITIPNYASLVGITISSYDTCVSCHVMLCHGTMSCCII